MIDLNSPSLQASFKRIKRVSLVARVIMSVLAVLSAALAIWLASKPRRVNIDWMELIFITLLIFASLCFIGMFVWTVFTARPYGAVMHTFIAEGFYNSPRFLNAADRLINARLTPEFTLMIVGDKLTAFLKGTENLVQFDLSPVKDYTSVCGNALNNAKKFLLCYCGMHGAESVIITNSLTSKSVTHEYVVRLGGELLTKYKHSYFIKHGVIK